MIDSVTEITLEKYKIFYNDESKCLYVYFINAHNKYGGSNIPYNDELTLITTYDKITLNGIIIENFGNKPYDLIKEVASKKINELIICTNELIKNNTIGKILIFK